MLLSEFRIGVEFKCGDWRYRCTDVGSRVVVAILTDGIRVVRTDGNGGSVVAVVGYDEAVRDGWFNGPPYALAERVFDEDDLPVCSPV